MTKWGKVTYFDGSYAVGPINTKADSVVVGNGLAHMPMSPDHGQDKPLFEYVDQPKPVEPRGLGAVVSASLKANDGSVYFSGWFVRGQKGKYGGSDVWENSENNMYEWHDLHDITILHEGYVG